MSTLDSACDKIILNEIDNDYELLQEECRDVSNEKLYELLNCFKRSIDNTDEISVESDFSNEKIISQQNINSTSNNASMNTSRTEMLKLINELFSNWRNNPNGSLKEEEYKLFIKQIVKLAHQTGSEIFNIIIEKLNTNPDYNDNEKIILTQTFKQIKMKYYKK